MATIATAWFGGFLRCDEIDRWVENGEVYHRYVTSGITPKVAGYKVMILQGPLEPPMQMPRLVSTKVLQKGAIAKQIEVVIATKAATEAAPAPKVAIRLFRR